jgi:hypothetical protein
MKTKKSKWFMTGMAALLPAFGLVLAGYPTDGGNGEYFDIPSVKKGKNLKIRGV